MTTAAPQDQFDEAQFTNDAQNDVPSGDFVVAPEGDFSMYVKPGSTAFINGEKDGRKWRKYEAKAVIDSQEARDATNLEAPTARISFFLDITSSGSLESGTNKNVQLGRLLKATGQAKPGWTFGAIEGQPFMGTVKHRADKDDASKVYVDVTAFAPAA